MRFLRAGRSHTRFRAPESVILGQNFAEMASRRIGLN
jgi:hypothetical protein